MAARIVRIQFLVAVAALVLTGEGIGSIRRPEVSGTGRCIRRGGLNGAAGTIEQARSLVAELEAQVERQRSELRLTEATLRRARGMLAKLEGDRRSGPQGYAQRNTSLSPEERRGLPEQTATKDKKWTWADDQATAEASARRLGDSYKVHIDPIPAKAGALTIKLKQEGRTIYSWEGHRYSVFVGAHNVLYRADFEPNRTGCAVIAYNLKGGKSLWKTHPWGVPVGAHSQYENRINLEIDDRHLVVYGNESFGRYIEILDLNTGKTVGQRLLGRPGSGG